MKTSFPKWDLDHNALIHQKNHYKIVTIIFFYFFQKTI
jgi:hypothetical protein